MSKVLRIAFVVEGPTDFVMLKAVIENLLEGRDFVPQVLQPEMSEAFKTVPGEDGGWPGVLRWCLQSADQGGGRLSNNPLFAFHDLLIFQLDTDVAGTSYSAVHTQDPFPASTLPCEEDCPPAATTDRLRTVALRWMGEDTTPHQIVFCTPSKALETWLLAGLFPKDKVAKRKYLECRQNPANTLQGKPMKRRLVRSGKKSLWMYKELASEFALKWGNVTAKCSEASRFEDDFLYAFKQLSG
ncbi:MAG: hypothetical protein JRD04_05375 [Deltaproteobacteria bacterium]|nr:hypothetical protein [Deltaproteobacteria bacterium]